MAGVLNGQSAVRVLEFEGTRLTYVVDGALDMVPGKFFPGIPAAYWTEHPEALDAQGRVAMSVGGLLVERAGRKLLVDAGLGPVHGTVSINDEPVSYADSGALPDTLAALGHRPDDVDTVAFTHLHVDHTGWAFVDGRKFFPAAAYLVAAEEWAPHARGETIPGAPGRADVLEPLAGTRQEIADGDEIFPGVRAIVTPGHSPGHTAYVVEAGERRVVAFGDVFHLPAQITHPEWPSLPDVDTAGVLAARRRIVDELARPGTIGFACHFGDQVFGRVLVDADGVARWQPVEAEAVLPAPRVPQS
ncbi:MBL fold metallo-hydrolase [Amycolatopsis rhabdoformis]|uniref:MBL fold metallo-hydrolase n=1 Tax=Amycolatopsis rhabdoformis TaxID=1448059 RepID=A0ABZ1IFF7_9PSEU|nr:MBL fold metallo-hydrolase [Amycolatopsis rhabdoformis]WSE32844.1 MBL fold metallo-hydrolase [Amycolatopsis rhabdoformis]